jgi:hypothetical protein
VSQTAVMNVLGSLNASSTYNPNGSITLVLPKSALGLATGETIYDIISYIAIITPGTSGTGSGVKRTVVNSALTPWGYTLIGNDHCADHITATGSAGGAGSTGGATVGPTGGSTGAAGATTTAGKGRFGGGSLSSSLLFLLGFALLWRSRFKSQVCDQTV